MKIGSEAVTTPSKEPVRPVIEGRRTVYLIEAATSLEERVIRQWIGRDTVSSRSQEGGPNSMEDGVTAAGAVQESVPIPSTRGRRRGRVDPSLEAIIAVDDDPLMAPLRIAWLAEEVDGQRRSRWTDFVTLSDPRDPGYLRQRWVLARRPERCRVVVGEPALLSELRERWHGAGGLGGSETQGLAEFVSRQATLALERAERRLRGARYKVPRLVHEEILGRPAFRGGLARMAMRLGRDTNKVAAEAASYLREISATHSPFVIDLVAAAIKQIYKRGYGESLYYDHERLREVYSLAQRYPVVFLPSHKSNLDHLVLQYALHEHGHPPNHTAGGINMNFFPVGPLLKRAGVFFIRRSFKDNEVYKFVLRHYIDYLVEKRFSLEWYIEGGRSRSGKMLPPRFGLLAYVVDSYLRGKSEDVALVPVSIAYDQIQDVGDYVAEQGGAAKQAESFRWFIRFVRRLGRRYGKIHIRFGDPVSLRECLGPPPNGPAPDPHERSLELRKLAFEVCVRINAVTPVTPTSLVTFALLGVGGRALRLDEVCDRVASLVEYGQRRGIPMTESLSGGDPEPVRRVLDHLAENGVVSCFDAGDDAVYNISSGQYLAAAYYRNTIIHFFLNDAIAELALLAASDDDVEDCEQVFWDEAMRLRDLLKFEFFFSDKAGFRQELVCELELYDENWRERLAGGPRGTQELIRSIRPFNAHRVLRPFLEAYRVVADGLARLDGEVVVDEAKFLSRCLAIGKQYRLQRRITRDESVSKELFSTALKLARNRGVVDGDGDLGEKRKAFAAEIRAAVKRVEAVNALATSRRAGLLD